MLTFLRNLNMTFAIAAMSVAATAIAIVTVLAGLFFSLSSTVETDTRTAISSATRISAEILRVNLPSLEVVPDETGNVAALNLRSMPRFRSHEVIDAIARVSGQDVAIYVYDPEVSPDFTIGTTSLIDAEGERLFDDALVAGSAAHRALIAQTVLEEPWAFEGVNYIRRFQPIARADGTVLGAMMVAVDRGPIEAVLGRSMLILFGIGGLALVVFGLLAFGLSRLLTRPIPQLSNAMETIAEGDLDLAVPFRDRRNEIGAMARAVDIFRRNGLEKAALDAQARQHLAEVADHTGQLEAISRSQMVVEFTLEGIVTRANDNFLALLGYQAPEVIGRPNALFLFDVDPSTMNYRQFWIDLAGGAFKTGEYRRRTRDGGEVWIQSTFTPIADAEGKPYKVVQFASDVTDRKKSVAAIGAGLKRLAEGDLTGIISKPFPDEFDDLRIALNGTIERFSDVVGQLQTTARSLRVAGGELLSGANDLSDRTTRQAATIEQTSAAMEALADTVGENAGRAEDAAKKAEAVSGVAAASGAYMGQATEAMERITQSSARISNIIGLIDDIAFQTNLLALNASVEAARAGEAGKGFAVVAVEVRRLAQSAAQASADVKALVEQSGVEVKGGAGLVAAAGDQLANMLAVVEENSSLVRAIARACREQAASIGEVTASMRLLDEVTQHNAALVEETHAAIEQTEAQTHTLDQIVAIFHVHEPPLAPARAA
jgi:methyl-accepting chemotaxis protein